MSCHPIRRDLWTDPALKDKSVSVWTEYAKNHPMSRVGVNVDYIGGHTSQVSFNTMKLVAQKYADFLSNDSKNGAKDGSKGKRRSPVGDVDEADIVLVLSNQGSGISQEKRIKPSTPLRSLFNEFAEGSGVPLRYLRFSFNGSTLFLSSLGQKTAKDLNMANFDCISVDNIQIFKLSSDSIPESAKQTKPSSKGSKRVFSKKQQKKKKSNKSSKSITLPTEQTPKETHSVFLSKLFEEAEPMFRAIRQKLNTLALDCKSPKARSPIDRKREASPSSVVFNPNTCGLGVKAGKTCFLVNVGQVDNLYISSKRSSISPRSSVVPRLSIDLHGCTKDEAITILNEVLIDWMDVAMKGEYPWVMPAEIVCGAGNQVLSETVESWIKEKKNVANALKGNLLCQ